MEIKVRLPLSGVGAERSIEVIVLSLCAVWVCTGVCASMCAAARRALCASPKLVAKALPPSPQPGHR